MDKYTLQEEAYKNGYAKGFADGAERDSSEWVYAKNSEIICKVCGIRMPYAFGMKKRDWETGKILGLDIINAENIVGKNVLIVDDICSRGGTFYHSAKALKAAGAKSVSLYVTHLEATVMIGDLPDSGLIDHIYTTKSIFPQKELARQNIDGELIWGNWISIIE